METFATIFYGFVLWAFAFIGLIVAVVLCVLATWGQFEAGHLVLPDFPMLRVVIEIQLLVGSAILITALLTEFRIPPGLANTWFFALMLTGLGTGGTLLKLRRNRSD